MVFVGGGAGELPPHWIWPSLPLVCLKTSLTGKVWFPVTAEILLNCSSYQSTLTKRSKQIVFNFDSCYASSSSNGPILHSSYYLFIVHVVVSTSFVFYVHPLCRLTYFLFLFAKNCNQCLFYTPPVFWETASFRGAPPTPPFPSPTLHFPPLLSPPFPPLRIRPLNSPSPFIPGLRILFGTGLNFPSHS